MYIQNVKARFEELKIVPSGDLHPCTKIEIHVLERRLNLSLPKAYEEFLLWMGHGAGDFMRGSEFFYEQLLPLHKWAIELLAENRFPEPLPEDAFVFYMHQGYQFAFLRVSEGNDPPVYYYNETMEQTSFVVTNHSFSGFLLEWIENYAKSVASQVTAG